MNTSEKYISRVMFKLKVYESEGQKYEDLFVKVMSKSNKKFEPVKAYGNIGDRKNDGFDKSVGKYYQVFAPEEIDKKTTIYEAVNKLSEDFYGLKKHWDLICPIKEYYYVVNDKYKGVPAPIHEEIIKINRDNDNTIASIFTARHLEDELFKLEDDDIIDITGFVPNDNIDNIDFSILNETIKYIIECDYTNPLTTKLDVPDFEDKILFNKLGQAINDFLTVASYQIGDLDKYFKVNSDYAKNELKLRFQEMYEESKSIVPETNENFGDERFLYILKEASFNEKKSVRDAVLVLMSYYFETCDIFEKPVEVQ